MEKLIRLSDILVLDAITRKDKKSFNISDVCINQNGKIIMLQISGKGIFGLKYVVYDKDIDEIKKDRILIKQYDRYGKKMKELKNSAKRIINKQLITEEGEVLGRLSDIYFNIERMQIMAVEVSRSLFEDLFTGRTIIPGNIIIDRLDSVVIMEQQLENSIHNTKGIINKIDDGIKNN